MLIGTYRLEIDDKGRLALPDAWRPSFSRGLVLTRGVEKNLLVFPMRSFKTVAEEIGTVGIEPADARDWSRFLIGSAIQQPLGKLGRLEIPEPHRVFAELQKEVVLVGVMNRVEIWAKPKYETYETKTTPQIVQIAERFDELVRTVAGRRQA